MSDPGISLNLLPVTLLFAALNGFLYLALSVDVVRRRVRQRVSLGTGGKPDLEVAVRVHGNFAEYVPLALLLMALTEANGAGQTFLYVLGALLTVGRLSHAYGLHKTLEANMFRGFGMMTVWGVILAASGYGLYVALGSLTGV